MKQLFRLNLTARKQADYSFAAERKILTRLFGRLLRAVKEFYKGFFLSSHRAFDFKFFPKFRNVTFAPRESILIVVEIIHEVFINNAEILDGDKIILAYIAQEVASVGNKPCTGKIHQPDIMRLRIGHKLVYQMVYGRIILMILSVCITDIIKNRICLARLLTIERRSLKPDIEFRVNLSDFPGKKLTDQLHSLLPVVKPPPRRAEGATIRFRSRRIKQRHAPCGLPVIFQDIILPVSHGIPHRIRAYIKPKIDFFVLHIDNRLSLW